MAQGKRDAKQLRSTAQALEKERTRRAEQVQALKERYREKDVTRRDNQKRRELRAKIVRHASALSQKLLRPTDNQHIPEDMRSAVAKVLESINQESSPNARSFTLDPVTKERIYKEPGTPTNRTVAFQNLKEQYQKIAQDGDMVVDPSLLGGDDVTGGFSEVIKMGDTRLADPDHRAAENHVERAEIRGAFRNHGRQDAGVGEIRDHQAVCRCAPHGRHDPAAETGKQRDDQSGNALYVLCPLRADRQGHLPDAAERAGPSGDHGAGCGGEGSPDSGRRENRHPRKRGDVHE